MIISFEEYQQIMFFYGYIVWRREPIPVSVVEQLLAPQPPGQERNE